MPQPPAYSRPDGFPDRSPQVCQSFRSLEQQLMEFFSNLSFEEVSPPVLEYADLYTSGFVGRQRVGDLFEVPMDEGRDFPALPGGRQTSWDAVLRPDLTSPMARMFLCGWLGQPQPAAPHPVRWISAGPVFRRVAPGRFNEQRQVGVEWFCPPPLPSPDTLRPAVMMLKWALAFTGRLQSGGAIPAEVRIGHRGLMLALLPDVPADQRERLWGGVERLRQARHWAQRATDGKLAALWRDHPQWQRRAGIAAPDAATIRRLLPSLEEGLIHAAWRGAGVDPAALEPLVGLDSLDDLVQMARSAADSRPDPGGALAEILTVLQQTRDTVARVGPPGLPLLLSADPSRGFGYYDGLTFEIHGTVGGGGGDGPGDARKRRWVGGGHYRLDTLAARIAASTGLPLPPAALSGVGMAFDLDNLTGAAR